MNINEILEKVKVVCKNISDNDSGIWHTSEWNICSHIQSGLVYAFPEYNLDVELIKHDGRRPDIVIHHRGNNTDNLVVFQVKIRPTAKDLQDDMDKINETFFAEPYNYKFGVLISIGQLPKKLPEFDKGKVGILEVYGWALDETTRDPVTL
ncbi:MAG TPA: hypothetical protein PKA42_02320 [Candidatus Paceibacterota bacterium]|nr:hypothetical protein [Candidatus Paceibacterota bacterium]HMO82979.1 hypothetical protein [Candidatus Paceibacterota bacterium]